MAKCDTIKGVETHGSYTANSREGGSSGGIDKDQGAPSYQVAKDRSSFVCE